MRSDIHSSIEALSKASRSVVSCDSVKEMMVAVSVMVSLPTGNSLIASVALLRGGTILTSAVSTAEAIIVNVELLLLLVFSESAESSVKVEFVTFTEVSVRAG